MSSKAKPRAGVLRLSSWLAMAATATLLTTGGLAGPSRAAELLREETSGLQYLEVVTGGAAVADPLPIVIALHGLGDNPDSFRLLLDDLPAKARVIVPRGPMPHGEDGFSWFNFHADDADGAVELGAGVNEAAQRVARLLDALTKKYNGPSRSVACGFSQGGMLSFALAAAHPELLISAIPISGYLPSTLWPTRRPTVRPLPKVLALHGEADPLISLESATWSVEALRSNGYDAQLRSWAGVAHALSPAMRATLLASVLEAVQQLTVPGPVAPGPVPSGSVQSGSVQSGAPGVEAKPAPSAPETATTMAPAAPAQPALDRSAP